MQYAGAVNTVLTNVGSQYTVPSNQYFEGQVTRESVTTNIGFQINSNSTAGQLLDASNQYLSRLKLGAGSYIRNVTPNDIRVTGARFSN